MAMMTTTALEQVREVMLRGTTLSREEHRRDVLSKAALFKAALKHLDAVRERARNEGRTFAVTRLAEMKAELIDPLLWIAEAEGATPPAYPAGFCSPQ